MTLLQLIQEFCRRQGLSVPSTIMASHDDQLIQLAGLANEILEDLTTRRTWTTLDKECVFTSVAGSDQGALETLAPGLLKILNDTLYDRTQGVALFGPNAPRDWQASLATTYSGPSYRYRIQGGHLLTMPDMPIGHQVAFEYASSAAVQDNKYAPTTVSYKSYFTRDDDTFLLPSKLLLLGLRWRWKEEKGLPYAESFRLYEASIADTAGGDGTKAALDMGAESRGNVQPGIVVPIGNWSVP